MSENERRARRRVLVAGVVQGVGFRPFVYTIAQRHNLVGHVGNNSAGVFAEVEGPVVDLDRFLEALVTEAPPLSHIERVKVEELELLGEEQFTIVLSEGIASESTLISPDVCVCDDCLRETLDPLDRRYRYPFTNCTNCGPRFSIIRDIPYDRPLTTMAPFKMCPICQAEYDNPFNRRFHAQPNACPVCGPHVWLELSGDRRIVAEKDAAILMAQAMLAEGRVIGVKGLGGFHLACNATDDRAVQRLRDRKGRVSKPFAVMAASELTVQAFAELSEEEGRLLRGRARPIVLLKKRNEVELSQLVSPGNPMVGVMLPYTPLHQLLLEKLPFDPAVLIMTSGNYSDEPIVCDNSEARERLDGLADAFLLHNRDIEARCDDSVIRVWRGTELPIRRSRGYTPFPVQLPFSVPPVLATGGELKATFCLTKGDHAFLSQHIGDMENLETLEAFTMAAEHFRTIFRVDIKAIVCDRHPGYLSTRWAMKHSDQLTVIQVQHHHAHIASVMAENGLRDGQRVIGISFDGTGYGDDGAIWGGEVLLAQYDDFERAAHLAYMPLPGGDASIKRPYRLAMAYLWQAGIEWDDRLMPIRACPVAEREVLLAQLEKGINVVPTSSMGRLFDVVSALAGVCQTVTYEAQAAIELEAKADLDASGSYQFDLRLPEIDIRPVLRAVVTDVLAGTEPAVVSARFHRAVAELVLQASQSLRATTGINRVALSGGVFQNVTLLELAARHLEEAGFDLLVHHKVPPNDGGLALGQAVIAAQSSAP